MSKVRVYEVARELGIKNKELVALFQSLGFSEVRNHMSAVEESAVDRVKRKLERRDEPEMVEERISKGVVKRRSRGRRVAAGATAEPKEAKPAEPPAKKEAEPAAEAPPVKKRAAKKKAPAPPPEPVEAKEPEPVEAKEPEPVEEVKEPEPVEAKEPEPAPAAEPEVDETPEPEPVVPAPPDLPREVAPDEAPDASVEAEAAGEAEAPPAAVEAEPEKEAEAEATSAAPEAPEEPEEPVAPPPAEEPEPAAAPDAEGRAEEEDGESSQERKRPTSPPKTGIEVWEGRPGVPMPQRPQTRQRRTTYDPRASGGSRYGGRPVPGRPHRPGYRPRYHQRHQRKGPAEVSTKEMSDRKKVIKIEGEVTLQSFADKMSMKATDLLMKLLGMGMTGVNINSTLDADTAKLLAEEFGWRVEDVSIDVEEELEAAMEPEEDIGEAIVRPPIVTVMGHVDHGKTTLLDSIRNESVAAGEAGGITQHIGAYRVETPHGTLCFLDTPGHEAFTAMRARGAGVTDIVILVVAADDGVMPQTREAINHSKSAGVPIIVAVNKIDKPGVEPDRVMRELSAEGLTPEAWGGETIFANVSALEGRGIEQLLEMVLLQAELLELEAHPDKRATGVVVEALLDKGRGSVARVLVQDGTLHWGDVALCGTAYGKVRAMTDETGKKVKKAGPATPVEVLGLNEVPEAGDPMHALPDLKQAETLSEERRKSQKKTDRQDSAIKNLSALREMLASEEQLELKVILKADVQGSVEALRQALEKQSTKRVKLTVVHTGVGGITETDVNLAVASGGIIIGFNVRPAGKSRKLAEQEDVEIRLYSVIYEAIEDVRSAMEGLLPATKVEKELGKAEVRQTFRISKVGVIAGCMVTSGVVKRNAEVRLVRDDVVVWTGKLDSLKRFKDDAREVREGFECGIGLENFNDVKEGDIIECFTIEEVKAKLEE